MSRIDLSSYSRGDLDQLYRELQAEKDRLDRLNAYWNHVPSKKQREWWDSTASIKAILGANQVGKTTYGVNWTLSKASHTLPKVLGGNPSAGFPTDVAIGEIYLACGESFDQVWSKTIVPKLREYLTDDMLAGDETAASILTPRSGLGELRIRFRSGAELVVMAYQQARQVFEGGVYNGVWFDEEPPEEIWHAVRRGLIRRQGWTNITATSLDQVYLHDQVMLPFEDEDHPRHKYVHVFEMAMHDACRECEGGYLPHDRIMEFANSISDPNERAARIYGKIRKLQGVNFKYVNPKDHVVPDFDVPMGWPLVEVCDPSMTRGLWVGWFTKDPDDLWYMVQSRHIEDASFRVMAAQLKRLRQLLGKEPDLAIMDRRGGAAMVNKYEQTKWFDAFADENIDYVPSEESPLEKLHDWLEPKWHPRKEKEIPKLRFFRTVEQEEKGPMWALSRFKWDDTRLTSASKRKKQDHQEPKDWIDVMKYLAAYGNIDTMFLSMGQPMQRRGMPLVETYSHRRRRGNGGGHGSFRSFPMSRGH